MTINYYSDEMMPRPVAKQLLKQGLPVIMAVDTGMVDKSSVEHLTFANDHQSVLVTLDRPLAWSATDGKTAHHGVVCWLGNHRDFGAMIGQLSKFAKQQSSETTTHKVFWLE
jgi:hypothetical protein